MLIWKCQCNNNRKTDANVHALCLSLLYMKARSTKEWKTGPALFKLNYSYWDGLFPLKSFSLLLWWKIYTQNMKSYLSLCALSLVKNAFWLLTLDARSHQRWNLKLYRALKIPPANRKSYAREEKYFFLIKSLILWDFSQMKIEIISNGIWSSLVTSTSSRVEFQNKLYNFTFLD